MEQDYVYSCEERNIEQFPSFFDEVWSDLPEIQLIDTETGHKPRLSTTVKIFWNKVRDSVCFQFYCQDNNIVSTMKNHDDPIYKEDVVEVFISETGSLTSYKEFEVSPANVKFDAAIYNNPDKALQVMTDWHAEGWKTDCYVNLEKSQFISVWEIPFKNFSTGTPVKGTEWRINCYRIDRNSAGQDEYTAWSPTGKADFHMPDSFGYLRFD